MIPVDILARVPLMPVLLAQAIAVRRKALILPEPPGARHGNAGTGPSLRVLIVGDSSAAGVGAPTQDAALSGQLVSALSVHFAVTWRLEAATGATTKTALARLTHLSAEPFDIAVLALGVNDVTRLVPRAQWAARQLALHRMLADRFGVRHIYASGVPPMHLFPLLPQPLRWVLGCQSVRLNVALAGIAAQNAHLSHIPFEFPPDPAYVAKDGYHPSPLAYTHWAKALSRRIVHDQ